MSGYIRINRKVFKHPIFKEESFTEILAWIDLISRASWKADTIRFNQYTKNVARGELVVSPKYLALKCKWHVSKVRRFLGRLAFAKMIGIVTDEGITRIKIINYNEYQHSATTLQATLQANQHGKSDHILNNNKLNNKYIYTQNFNSFWDNIPSKMRKAKGKRIQVLPHGQVSKNWKASNVSWTSLCWYTTHTKSSNEIRVQHYVRTSS